MLHLDPDRLMLGVLGDEPLTEQESDHLATCARCAADLGSMRQVVDIAQHTQGLSALPMPPPRVWDRIQTELAATGRAVAPPPVAVFTDAPVPAAAPEAAPPHVAGGQPRRRRSARARRGPTWFGAALVAAAAAAVAAAVTAVVVPRPAAAPQAAPCASVPTVRLEALPGVPSGVSGYACLRTVDGQRRLHIHADGMPPQADGDYEAWLLDSTSLSGSSLRMEALGVLGRGSDQDLTVADNLDLSRFNIVDISAEPHDGNAAHSGQSMLRGRLR